jgi:hypothetical protein
MYVLTRSVGGCKPDVRATRGARPLPHSGRGDDDQTDLAARDLFAGRHGLLDDRLSRHPSHLYRLPVAGKRADDECREDAPRARLPSSAHPLVAMRRTAGTLGAVKRTDVAGALEGDRMGVHAVAQPLLGE